VRQRLKQRLQNTVSDQIVWGGTIDEIDFSPGHRWFHLLGADERIRCTFTDEHEEMIREAVGESLGVVVTGLASFTGPEQPVPSSIIVDDIEVMEDTAGVLSSITIGERHFVVSPGVPYVVRREGPYVLAESEEFHLCAYGPDEDSALLELHRDFAALVEGYAFEQDDMLAPSGLALKQRLIALLRGVGDPHGAA
jgi:hypothetical protein